ncbi:hypothetical protein SDRG_13024 [Saprolegnia diclina VS20]|uniref:WRKY19-like zinc finger domain-containing protein n=1 Tax=Saprolegnia diclina (strain VS20) TaxID=1156394 RepID=T0Q3J0_SAPDV|nr:hypothetical protein SDRG_13024 [Saprolegnia diclina VS20]EQC29151.1 hypothetical protein SDRG_13024 [Saprolegnia diclina VS20]|eukprot:XP_008617329.1 hypothetical protein SDRG_13024 [Saprolegnia diclina VS20]
MSSALKPDLASAVAGLHDLVMSMESASVYVDGAKKKRKLKKCIVHGCASGARSKGLCKAHGGGKRCGRDGCNLSDQGGGYCIRHGGGKRCEQEGCDKSAQSKRFCKAHGGGVRCDVKDCMKSSQGGGKCRAHGGGPRWMRSMSASETSSTCTTTGTETPPRQPSMNSRLSLSVIDKIKSKNLKTIHNMSPLRKDTLSNNINSHGGNGVPELKSPMEMMPWSLPPLSVALKQEGYAPSPNNNASCIYPTCKHASERLGFCTFHSSQFCCQVAGCAEKRLRGGNLCATHNSTANLAKCLLHLISD